MANCKVLDDVATALEGTDRFRILRRVPDAPVIQAPVDDEPIFKAAVIDTETTGINPETDELIELAIAKLEYGSVSGRIVGLLPGFEGLRQPSRPLPDAIQRLTGLTEEMLRDQRIDGDAVAAQLVDVNIILAHNAAFDRAVIEKAWPNLPPRPWGCTMTEIDWTVERAAGRRVSDILELHGLYHDGHRASADVKALIHALSLPLPVSGTPMLAAILASARRNTAIVVADAAPYEASSTLRSRGYRWSPRQPKAWFREIPIDDLTHELEFFDTEIYRGTGREPSVGIVGATERYRGLTQIANRLVPASQAIAQIGK